MPFPPARPSRRPALVTLVLVGTAASGCVQADPDRPWSTRDRSSETLVASTPAAPSEAESIQVAEPIRIAPPPTERSTTPSTTITRGPQPARPPAPRTVAATEPIDLDGETLWSKAASRVVQSTTNDYSLVRAYAFEAMEHAPSLLVEHGGLGLVDDNRGVRFVTTMAAGRVEAAALMPLLEAGLVDDSESVQAATIFALRRLGQPVDPSPLAGMARGSDPEVRGNAFMILGMLGNRSAIPVIESALGRGMRLENPMRIRITELQAAESLVMLGDESDVEPIRAALFAPVEQGELTVLACDMLGRLQDQQARSMLMRLVLAEGNQMRPAEIRVAAAGAVLRLPEPHEPVLEDVILEYAASEDPLLRTQVAGALAHARTERSRAALATLLEDPNPIVSTAAAGSILARPQAGSGTSPERPSSIAVTPSD